MSLIYTIFLFCNVYSESPTSLFQRVMSDHFGCDHFWSFHTSQPTPTPTKNPSSNPTSLPTITVVILKQSWRKLPVCFASVDLMKVMICVNSHCKIFEWENTDIFDIFITDDNSEKCNFFMWPSISEHSEFDWYEVLVVRICICFSTFCLTGSKCSWNSDILRLEITLSSLSSVKIGTVLKLQQNNFHNPPPANSFIVLKASYPMSFLVSVDYPKIG